MKEPLFVRVAERIDLVTWAFLHCRQFD